MADSPPAASSRPSALYASSLMPQADTLAHVEPVVQLVADGKSSVDDIAKELSFTPRQGGYYRLAASQLGLLDGERQLTDRGRRLLAASGQLERREILLEGFFANPLLSALVDRLRAESPSERQIVAWLEVNAGLSESTARRRWTSVRKWLLELDLASQDEHGFALLAPAPLEAEEDVLSPRVAHRLDIVDVTPLAHGERVEMRGSERSVQAFLEHLGGKIVVEDGRIQPAPGALAVPEFQVSGPDATGVMTLSFVLEDSLPRPEAYAKKQKTGPLFEEAVSAVLREARYSYKTQQRVGTRPAGGRHVVDHLVEGDVLISTKWQQVGGTAEQKVPYEVLSLKKVLEDGNGRYRKAYLILDGPGWSPGMLDYCRGQLLDDVGVRGRVEVLSLDQLRARAKSLSL